MSEKKRIVITGMGLVSCFGSDVKEFYKNLLAGKSGVANVTKFPVDDFPTKFAATVKDFNPEEFLDKKSARRVSECIAYGVAVGKMAALNADLDLGSLDLHRCGVLLGSGMGGMDVFTREVQTFTEHGTRRVSPFFVPYILTNMPGALLAIDLGFKGPNYSISTACATSNYSIKAAADHILLGHADVMIAGGIEASAIPMCLAGFSALKALSRNNENPEGASKPWDKNRDGFVIGEGGGAIVLETLEHALKRGAPILAEYKGGAVTCDAHHMTEPTPDGSDVARCISLALKDAGLTPEDVDYINAHATSTPVGDLCEIRAVKRIFASPSSRLKMNSTKSMIGHALGAAGALEAIATIMAIQTDMVHPTINLRDPEDELEWIDVVRNGAIAHQVKVALSNSFGFGGHNSVVVFAKYER